MAESGLDAGRCTPVSTLYLTPMRYGPSTLSCGKCLYLRGCPDCSILVGGRNNSNATEDMTCDHGFPIPLLPKAAGLTGQKGELVVNNHTLKTNPCKLWAIIPILRWVYTSAQSSPASKDSWPTWTSMPQKLGLLQHVPKSSMCCKTRLARGL